MNTIISRIADKIKFKGYKLNPVISIQEVERFELQNKITLPNEYRSFITQIGNGGKGPPYYDLLTLNEAFIETKSFNKECEDFLSKGFPLTDCWVWESEENWSEELKERIKAVYQGILFLGTEGCGQYWTLIISGSLRGQVWNIADVGATPCLPNMSFLEWYEYWLDGGSDWWRE